MRLDIPFILVCLVLLFCVFNRVFAMSICTGNFQAFVSTDTSARNSKDWNVVTGAAILIGSAMCVTMGTAGYLYFRDNTDGVIIDNFTAPGYDVFKIMIAVHLIFYVPAAFVIMRYSVVKLFLDQISEQLPIPMHLGISLSMMAVITAVVLVLQSTGLSSGEAFSLVLDLTGGLAGSTTSFIIPAAVFMKIVPDDGSWRHFEAKVVFGLGFVIMFTVCIFSILSIL